MKLNPPLVSFFMVSLSISEYQKQCLKQERKANLEHRRNHIQTLLQEEVNQVEAELRGLECDRKTWKGRQHQKKGEHSTERQEWRGKVGYQKRFQFIAADTSGFNP